MNTSTAELAALCKSNTKTHLNLVIGYPLAHTQSPLLHNTLYQLLSCNAVMRAHATQDLTATLQAAKAHGVQLLAITMPYKRTVLPLLDYLSPAVENLQAANTVILRDGNLHGYNTDIAGIAYALKSLNLSHKNVLIVGAGGAARAAAYYLNQQRANLFWLNRTAERVPALLAQFGGEQVELPTLATLPLELIINATPLGLYPDMTVSPLPNYPFRAEQTVFDMVYNPVTTQLLTNARARGASIISGLDMFIGQGLRQVELWLNESITTQTLVDSIKTVLGRAQFKREET